MSSPDRKLMPREKAMANGIKSLTDLELMALLFGTGVQGKDVFALCEEVLQANEGHLSLVAKMDWRTFTARFKGVGPAKALTLLAALELGVRSSADALTLRDEALDNASKVFELMRPHFYGLRHEEFWTLLLNNSNRLIHKARIAQGGITATTVDLRILLHEAILSKASCMIVLHNHPSGQLRPSAQDLSLTRKIQQGCEIFGIRLLDHIIVTDNNYHSLHDSGEMP